MEEKKEEHKHGHHAAHKSQSKGFRLDVNSIILGLVALLVIIIAVNVIMSLNIGSYLKEKTKAAEEAARPAKIELAVIKNSKCTDCSDIAPFVDFVKSSKVEITSEKTLEFDSKEAKTLIAKYSIEKVPSIVITGEIDKAALEGFVKKDDALVLAETVPPYTSTKDGKTVGRVTLYYLYDPSCTKCNDLGVLISQISFSGIKIVKQINISISSSEGSALAQKYNLQFAPALVLSKDAKVYLAVSQGWSQIGTEEKDGSFVLRAVYPPFINLTTKETRGIVDAVYLADKGCADCYNVSVHKDILTSPQSFAMVFGKEEKIDISDAKGKELIARYNITQVPTIILSKDASVYPSSDGLKQFFSVEKDGVFVFRAPSVLGNYRDLATNQIVRPQAQQ